jgi:hypothetical protein
MLLLLNKTMQISVYISGKYSITCHSGEGRNLIFFRSNGITAFAGMTVIFKSISLN